MSTLKELQEQKAALDFQISEAVKQAKIKQKALELKMEEKRKFGSSQAISEIKKLINEYGLTKFDIFDDIKPEPKEKIKTSKLGATTAIKSTLAQMRSSYNEIW